MENIVPGEREGQVDNKFNNRTMIKHFMSCMRRKPSEADIKILATGSRGRLQLAILEALFIREIKPALNTKDEWMDHKLSIKV